MPEELLIYTELDRTLIPNGPQPESPGARKRFSALVARSQVGLAYVSGRSLHQIRKAMRLYSLPRPDFIIADMGSSIYRFGDGRWHLFRNWHERIEPDWGNADHARIRSLLNDIIGLRAQEPAKQERFKLSYYVPLYLDPTTVKESIAERLRHLGVRSKLIYSVDEPRGIGLLDLLPASASKYHAIAFLSERLGLSCNDCLFAGNSGNDMEVLTSAIPAVLVANSSDEVRDYAIAGTERADNNDKLYCARGGRNGMNGNYAAGILEGIAHYRPNLAA